MISVIAFVIICVFISVTIMTRSVFDGFAQSGKVFKDSLSETSPEKAYFLHQADFDKHTYTLIIRHKETSDDFFLVDNQDAIRAHRDTLDMKLSWVNFLPAERGIGYGVELYEDGVLKDRKWASVMSNFHIGTLHEHGKKVSQEFFAGSRQEVEQQLTILKNKQNIIISSDPIFNKGEKDYSFFIYFPTISAPAYDAYDDKALMFVKQWELQLTKCLTTIIGESEDYLASVHHNSQRNPYIYNNKANERLRDQAGSVPILKDVMLYNFYAKIEATKETAERLFGIDYSSCVKESDQNNPLLHDSLKKIVKDSTSPELLIEREDVGVTGFKSKTSLSRAIERKIYRVDWYEILE